MKKHNFKKILSFFLVAIMLCSTIIMAIPVSAAVDTPIDLAPNEDNWVNGVKIRFETAGTDTYAKIEDGKIKLKMNSGDLLWFPELTIKDATTTISYKITSNSGNAIPYIVSGIDAKDSENVAYAQGYGNYQGWICARQKWNEKGTLSDSSYDDWYKKNGLMDSGSTEFTGNPILNENNTLETTTSFVMGSSVLRPSTTFQQSGVADPYVHVYGEKTNVNINGSFGIAARNSLMISLDEVSATNINGNDGSYSEDFETIESYSGPVVNMRQTGENVEFDSGIAFIDFMFQLDRSVTADTEFVVRKNGEVVERKAVSTFEAGADNVYTYSTYFMTIDYADVLVFCLEKDGEVLSYSTYEIDYGPRYKNFIENPPPVTSESLINVAYEETFDTAIVLQPGENDVNGKTWTYVKNSADGSAVIKDGRLYFTGSNNDMIIFEDLNVDQISYGMAYDLTYLATPSDDNWENWTCWFGGFYHLAAADADGNRFAYITSVTPNDVYMMKGTFGADGAFTREDVTDHAYFPNLSGSPTQPGELYYWNGRLGNGVPTTIKTFVGVNGYSYGGIGISAYSVTGSHQVSANMAGGADGVPTMDQRVGKLGFVCSDSKVSVIVDNLTVKTRGKNVVVDGETIQVPADGSVSVSHLQSGDKKIVYTTVDGDIKLPGETFAATKLTKISTVQVEFDTRKVVADGQTGLKWTTEINKADYEALIADANIAKVEVGTVVVPTADAKKGITIENATKNIAGEAKADGDGYTFSGVLAIDKDARDTSYSGIGYIKVTLKDDRVVVVYADYASRNHGFALSDLVDEFIDDDNTDNGNTDNGNSEAETNTGNETEEPAVAGKSCGGNLAGVGIVLVVALTSVGVVATKKKENN